MRTSLREVLVKTRLGGCLVFPVGGLRSWKRSTFATGSRRCGTGLPKSFGSGRSAKKRVIRVRGSVVIHRHWSGSGVLACPAKLLRQFYLDREEVIRMTE